MRKPPLLDDQNMAVSEESAGFVNTPRCWRCRQRTERATFTLRDQDDEQSLNGYFCERCNWFYEADVENNTISSSLGRRRENDTLDTYSWDQPMQQEWFNDLELEEDANIFDIPPDPRTRSGLSPVDIEEAFFRPTARTARAVAPQEAQQSESTPAPSMHGGSVTYVLNDQLNDAERMTEAHRQMEQMYERLMREQLHRRDQSIFAQLTGDDDAH